MPETTLGVGIIGVSPVRGWAATAHIPALRALPNYEIRALSAHSAESARAAGEVFGVGAVFSDHEQLVSQPDIDVVAVTETGSLVAASASGSQLGPYASGAGKVILVVGTQKIVSDLEDARRRIDEYAFPLEDARAQAAYGMHSGVNKVLIVNREWMPGRTTVVLVDEALGF